MYQILTDSCCDVPYELLEENNVDFISMYVSIDGTEFADDLGRSFKIDDFIKKSKTERCQRRRRLMLVVMWNFSVATLKRMFLFCIFVFHPE